MEAVQPSPAPEQSTKAPLRVRNFYLLCLPTLLGTVGFILSLPIVHSFAFLHSLYTTRFFTVWWLTVAPVCTLIAYILLMRNTWKKRWPGKTLALAWTTLTIASNLNLWLALLMFTGRVLGL